MSENKAGLRRHLANGYVRVLAPNHPLAEKSGYVLEHRMVVYDAGIDIPTGCEIHHKNGNRQDNGLENLEVISKRDHALLHSRSTRSNGLGTWPVLRSEEQRRERRRLQRQHQRRKAQERFAENPDLALHGKASTYIYWGCRCALCRAANTTHNAPAARRYRNKQREISR